MSRLKYDYKRKTITARMSEELYKLLRECCESIGVSRQDFITYAILYQLDPTEMLRDNVALSVKLRSTIKEIEQV